MIAEGGDARVIDLGVGAGPDAVGPARARAPAVLGARARGRHRNGAGPADIYSLGAIAYELITGRRVPGPGRPDVQVPEMSPAVADQLNEVLARALAEDPSERYPSAADLVDALAPLLPTGRRSTRKKTRPTADLPLPLEVGEPAAALEPFDPGEDLTDLVHRAPTDTSLPDR